MADEDDGAASRDDVRSYGISLALLCTYAFCIQFTPSEPYLVPFLTKAKHFSNDEVTTKIFPVSVYGTLVCTLLAAPACGQFSYRSVILMGALGRLATFLIVLFGKSLLSMQIMQVTYSLGVASDLVFSSYLFLLVKEDMFQALTSFTQAAATFSFLIAAELGQLLVYQGLSLVSLVYISTFMVGVASAVAFFLPRPPTAYNFFSRVPDAKPPAGMAASLQRLWELMLETWYQRILQILSLWWAFQFGGSAMIENYGTNLFDAVDSSSIYNGHVIAATQGASCLAALLAVPISNFAATSGGFVYVVGSGLTWLLCVAMASAKTLWIVYPAYIFCVAVNKLLLCVLYVQCAQVLSHGHYIFLFSLNAVAALVVQSLLQGFVEVCGVNIFSQFHIVGSYFLVLAIGFASLFVGHFLRMGSTVIY